MKLNVQMLNPGGRSSIYFDVLRGIAAAYVMVFHFREQLFVGFSYVTNPSLAVKAAYLATSIGYQFVMAFFVLSGFLISTSVVSQIRSGQWSWKVYLTNRLVRLWLVLIPALILTLGWDKFAILLSGNTQFYHSTLDWRDFLGSLFFVQGILTNTYGQNQPLWSLSYEFWYYILFPCIILMIRASRWKIRVFYALIVVGLGVFVGKTILIYFLVWILGLIVAVLPRFRFKNGVAKSIVVVSSVSVTAAVMIGVKILEYRVVGSGGMLSSFPEELATGVAFALLLYVVLNLFNDDMKQSKGSLSHSFSGMSYSLYLTHIPVIFALRVIIGHNTWQPNPIHCFIALCWALGIITYAYAVSRLTEFHTPKVRRWVLGRLSGIRRNSVSATGAV